LKYTITSLAVPGLLLAFLSTTVAAESSETDDGKIVVTATRTAQTVDQSLAAVTVISRDDIERVQATDIVELLRTQAGVDVARTGGPGQQTSVFLRGTNSNHVLVLIDGVRAASASTGIFAWQTLDPSQIDRIETAWTTYRSVRLGCDRRRDSDIHASAARRRGTHRGRKL
jgi:vitamin B12 transporter